MKTYLYSTVLIATIVACGGSKDKKSAPELPEENLKALGGASNGDNTGDAGQGAPSAPGQNPGTTPATPYCQEKSAAGDDSGQSDDAGQSDNSSQNGNDDAGQSKQICKDDSSQSDQKGDDSSQNGSNYGDKDDSGQNGSSHDNKDDSSQTDSNRGDQDDSGQNQSNHGDKDDSSQNNSNHSEPFACNEKMITFDGKVDGQSLKNGSLISDQYSRVEFTVDRGSQTHYPAAVFDTAANQASSHSNSWDLNLGNSSNLENVLVIANSRSLNRFGRLDLPGFNSSGGTIEIAFDREVLLRGLDSVDLDGNQSKVSIVAGNRTVRRYNLSSPNTVSRHYINSTVPSKLVKVYIDGTGGIDNLRYCEKK